MFEEGLVVIVYMMWHHDLLEELRLVDDDTRRLYLFDYPHSFGRPTLARSPESSLAKVYRNWRADSYYQQWWTPTPFELERVS